MTATLDQLQTARDVLNDLFNDDKLSGGAWVSGVNAIESEIDHVIERRELETARRTMSDRDPGYEPDALSSSKDF